MVMEGVPETKTAARRRSRWGTRRVAGFSVVGLVAAAAAAAVVVTSTSAPQPAAPAAAASQAGGASAAQSGNPALTSLAADIVSQATPAGNATLEIRNHSASSSAVGANGIDLFTDQGIYYWGNDKANLLQAIGERQDEGQGQYVRAIDAAMAAVKGNVPSARLQMQNANQIPGAPAPSAAQQALAQKTLAQKLAAAKKEGIKVTLPSQLTAAQKKETADTYTWMNSVGALTADPYNAQVRAGVLDILATLPEVNVTRTGGTLTIAASWSILPSGGGDTLVINATTGAPVSETTRTQGVSSVTTYFHPIRVTMTNVEAGKF